MTRRSGVILADSIGAIAKQMDRLASQTGRGAPRIELGPYGTGTVIRYKRKTHRIADDAWVMKLFLRRLSTLFRSEGWGWEFVLEGERRLELVPVAGSEAKATAKRAPIIRSIEEIVGPERLLVGDAECVDSADDYVDVIGWIAEITGGALAPSAIRCEEGARRALSVVAGGKTSRVELQGATDWLDVAPLLACLNRLIRGPRRLYEVRKPGWGQEFGVAFATRKEAAELDASGYREVG